MRDFARAREQMVEKQIARRGVRDPRVLKAMGEVPREDFVSRALRDFAYDDAPLPIGEDQTISQPYIVGLMIQTAAVKPGDKVLEVGAGSGYAAAALSRIAAKVYAIERRPALAEAARKRHSELGYDNVDLRVGDGAHGLDEAAPFDAILVSAGGESVPPRLKEQLVVGGRLVIPVGSQGNGQRLLRITRRSAEEYEAEDFGAVSFVPLIVPENEGDGTKSERLASEGRPGT
jgi:protein-L-isoaspartate(D-aspartate) O-methyltransferase